MSDLEPLVSGEQSDSVHFAPRERALTVSQSNRFKQTDQEPAAAMLLRDACGADKEWLALEFLHRAFRTFEPSPQLQAGLVISSYLVDHVRHARSAHPEAMAKLGELPASAHMASAGAESQIARVEAILGAVWNDKRESEPSLPPFDDAIMVVLRSPANRHDFLVRAASRQADARACASLPLPPDRGRQLSVSFAVASTNSSDDHS